MFYVYVIKSISNHNKIYIGFSTDLKNRFYQHNRGESTYTNRFLPWKLVYYETYSSQIDARNRERQLKRHAKAWGQLKGRICNSLNES